MLGNLYQFNKELKEKNIFFCFCGPLSQDLLVEIGHTLRNKMKLETNASTIVKFFSLFVEQAQNIVHYSAEKVLSSQSGAEELSSGIIVIGYEGEHYYIVCGNQIENNAVDRLQEKLTLIKNMSKEELKSYYKEQRRKEADKESKGAGLGFIELARKATRPIEFEFQPIDEHFSFFSLKTTI